MNVPDTQASVVVTGVGLVTPAGRGEQPLWSNWCGSLTSLGDYRDQRVRTRRVGWFGHVPPVAAEEARESVPHRLRKFGTRATYNAVLAAGDAIAQAGADWCRVPEERRALYVAQDDAVEPAADIFATALAADVRADEALFGEAVERLARGRAMSPFSMIKALNNNALALVSVVHGFRGDCAALLQGCGGTIAALAHAVRALRTGLCDTALVVGTGSFNHPVKLAAAYHGGLLGNPSRGLPPQLSFDARYDAVVLGEGAAAVVLERAEDAARRPGARVRSEVLAAAVRPLGGEAAAPEADARRLSALLAGAGRRVADLDAVVADGRGTAVSDDRECAVLQALLGEAVVPVSTVRPVIGTIGAAAPLVDLALAGAVLRSGRLPGVPHLTALRRPARGLVTRATVRSSFGTALCLQGGVGAFGGALLVGRPPAGGPAPVPQDTPYEEGETR
ncbi:beta-ketoacyl synthase N-terminal-like domain-containing protein [Streptomyces sp. NPDC055607]